MSDNLEPQAPEQERFKPFPQPIKILVTEKSPLIADNSVSAVKPDSGAETAVVDKLRHRIRVRNVLTLKSGQERQDSPRLKPRGATRYVFPDA